jgi:DNA-binding response OmpR family regulator
VDKDFLFKCFKSGVDDCIKSPFSIYDLAAKIFKILSLVEFSESIDFHGLKLFKKERYLIVNTSKIFITQKEVLILHTFFTRNTEISPKEFSSILKCNIPAVRMCINRLQKKLEKNTGMKIIKCRYGVGYYIAI